MKYIDRPYIKKTYIEDEQEVVIISLEDIRDNYVDEGALGKIGTIEIAKGYVSIIANDYDLSNIEEKEQVLAAAFREIFGKQEIDISSNIPYETIKGMIADGTLETFGYTKVQSFEDTEDFEFAISNFNDEFSDFNFDDELPENIDLEALTSTYRPRGRR